MKKLLVWDGDMTLWMGKILEDGPALVLPPGRRELLEELVNRGVLMSIASRNRPEDVLALLHSWGISQFFLYPQADLEAPKSAMIQNIVAALDLARLSDVVFLDDEPSNRAEVEAALPDVWAYHPGDLDAVVERHFTKPVYTDEDRMRVRRYQAEGVRAQAAKSYGEDYQAFLKTCDMKLTLRLGAREEEMDRVKDLVARANRMSAAIQPYTPEELDAERGSIIVGRVTDKFGDYGLSALALVQLDNPAQAKRNIGFPYNSGDDVLYVTIRMLLISCRLQGKGIGSALLGAILNKFGIDTWFRAEWRETEYNLGMRELYKWYKFEPAPAARRDNIAFALTLEDEVALPAWVQVEWDDSLVARRPDAIIIEDWSKLK